MTTLPKVRSFKCHQSTQPLRNSSAHTIQLPTSTNPEDLPSDKRHRCLQKKITQKQSTYGTRRSLQPHRTNIVLPTSHSRDICGFGGYDYASSRGPHRPTVSTILVEEQQNNDKLRTHQTHYWRNRFNMCRLLRRATLCQRQCRRSSR